MFPVRFFSARMFANRYYPAFGAASVLWTEITDVDSTVWSEITDIDVTTWTEITDVDVTIWTEIAA